MIHMKGRRKRLTLFSEMAKRLELNLPEYEGMDQVVELPPLEKED